MAEQLAKPSKEQVLDLIEAKLKSATLEQVSLSEVAQELGVTSRSIFKQFRTKLEIADALAARQLACLMAEFERNLATGRPEQKLAVFLAGPALHWIQIIEARPGMASVMVTAVSRQRRAVTNFRAFIQEKLQTILEEGQRVGEFRQFDTRLWARTIFDLMAVVGDPRVVQLIPLPEVSSRTDRVVSFILQSVLRETPAESAL